MKIWQKLFFFDTLKVLIFFLAVFWGLYVLIDYASHTGTFHHHTTPLTWKELIIFYTGELIRRSEVLLPFAILVACTRVITKLNVRNELVALLASGISLRQLLRPFLLVGLIGVFLLYLNEEFLIPWSMESSRAIGEGHHSSSSSSVLPPSANSLRLAGGSFLIFQTFNRTDNLFYDVWWVQSIDQLWRFKTLSADTIPLATEGEKLVRNTQGALISMERFQQQSFPEIHFNPKRLLETLTPPDELSLSELSHKLSSEIQSQKQARIHTAFYRKLLLPWLALWAVIIPAPLATRFSRRLNVFFIYVISLFALFFIYVLFNMATTLSERQIFSPCTALITPFLIVSLIMAIQLRSLNKLE